jgi:hypothetical protein
MAPKYAPQVGFDVGKQLSMAAGMVGVLLLLSHLAGQFRDGWAPAWSLVAGTACILVGVLFSLLFSILLRLQRIEQRISTSAPTEPRSRDTSDDELT